MTEIGFYYCEQLLDIPGIPGVSVTISANLGEGKKKFHVSFHLTNNNSLIPIIRNANKRKEPVLFTFLEAHLFLSLHKVTRIFQAT